MRGSEEIERIGALLRDHPKGLTIEEVSRKLGVNRATAAKYLNSMVLSGRAEMRALGPAKLFYLSNRLPLMNLMSLSSDLILVMDEELFIQHVNNTLLEYFGFRQKNLKGLRLDQTSLFPFFSDTGLLEHLPLALEGYDRVFELTLELGGHPTYFRAKVLPLVFEGGSRGVGLILEDVTEVRRYQMELEERVRERTQALERANEALQREIIGHQQTEEALAASRHFVEQILETTPNLIYTYTVDPFRIRYANANIMTILGYTADQVIGDGRSDFMELVHPDDRPILEAHLSEITGVTDGDVREIEYRVMHAGGHWVTLRCREVVFERGGEGIPFQVIGTAEDVTERRRAEDAIRKANRQLLLLNSITRHDILNQLNVLTTSLGLARTDPSPGSLLEHFEREERAVETIRRQITFTRDYQSIGAQPPQWQVVHEVIGRVLYGLDREGVAIETGGCLWEVYADLLIEKVFFNLIDNALRHGGGITRIRFSCREDERGLLIVCEDDGDGIPEEDKERIFDRAYGRNSGYGLFLVREILGITGLSIMETGVPGAGARFEIQVPSGLYRAAPETDCRPPEPA
ncbi:MAG TPA: PAS domain S-box protein [Methanoregulaceae archaeon]|nr:PAS domain S-box protein [Methanoregulaceae archaeon]